jgi:hypothetical protein
VLSGKEFLVDVAYERFLGPEIFFNPEIYTSTTSASLAQVLRPPLLDYDE